MTRTGQQHPPIILVVDDEPQIRRALASILDVRGYRVLGAESAEEALSATLEQTPDLIVLDLALPDMDGLQLLKRFREWLQIPVLVLSVRTDEGDKISALENGADDYLTKPFSAGELAARINALLRRSAGSASPIPVIRIGELEIDVSKRRVLSSGSVVPLTPTEFDILAYLVSNADRVVTSNQIIEHVWGPEYVGVDKAMLRVHVSNLRKKIEPHPTVPRYVLTEPGVGFRFATR